MAEPSSFDALCFRTEGEFQAWFNVNYGMFGIRRIVRSGAFFPDVRAELFNGRYIDIELEYHAKNFVEHGHNSEGCDLIISFLKYRHQTSIAGVPLIAIFDVKDFVGGGDYDLKSRELTPYFQELLAQNDSLFRHTLAKSRRTLTIVKKHEVAEVKRKQAKMF